MNKLKFFNRPKQVRASSEKIRLRFFINIDEDTSGWYALGHHDPEEFLATVVQQYPHVKLSCEHVELAWAIFESKDFLELIDKPIYGSKSITIIEDLETY